MDRFGCLTILIFSVLVQNRFDFVTAQITTPTGPDPNVTQTTPTTPTSTASTTASSSVSSSTTSLTTSTLPSTLAAKSEATTRATESTTRTLPTNALNIRDVNDTETTTKMAMITTTTTASPPNCSSLSHDVIKTLSPEMVFNSEDKNTSPAKYCSRAEEMVKQFNQSCAAGGRNASVKHVDRLSAFVHSLCQKDAKELTSFVTNGTECFKSLSGVTSNCASKWPNKYTAVSQLFMAEGSEDCNVLKEPKMCIEGKLSATTCTSEKQSTIKQMMKDLHSTKCPESKSSASFLQSSFLTVALVSAIRWL